MNQKEWLKLLEQECGEKIVVKKGFRKILKNEIVIKLRLLNPPKKLNELSLDWITKFSDNVKEIKKVCSKEGIPIILADTGDGIDIYIFISNLKTVAKQLQNNSKNKITFLNMIKMRFEQTLLVKAKIKKDILDSYNSFPKTLEEEVVSQMAPLVAGGNPKSDVKPILNKIDGAAPIDYEGPM